MRKYHSNIPHQVSSFIRNHVLMMIAVVTISNIIVLYLPKHSYQFMILDSHEMLARMVNFDGMQFIDNEYNYQQNFVFLPGFTSIVRVIKYLCSYDLNVTILVVTSLNRILYYLTAHQLYLITKFFNFSEQLSKFAIFLFIYSPSAIFYHSLYSEAIYAFIVFKAIQIHLSDPNQWFKFTILIALAVVIRSTAIFLLPIVGLEILVSFFKALYSRDFKKSAQYFLKGSIIILTVCLPMVVYLMWGYGQICRYPEAPAQCSQWFNIYSWVQQKYWNVGFLKYFNLNNIIFISIGLPSIIFSGLALQLHPKNIGIDISWILLLIITLTMTNIQSSTRFFSSHPLFYINMVSLIAEPTSKSRGAVQLWWYLYCFFGIFMFYLGFPWT